ncbi:MAG TPA: hypothetical protein VLT61_05655, partial [Anaeromyxobacteraceae bacterium]|nr:hypothetical protein [Anaeromyxobacteraceae bacterium]
MATTTFAVALVLLVQGAPPHRGEGKVLQATAARAYLDAGSEDGLTVGAEVAFRRAGAEVARCRLETVAERAATCAVRGVHPGDAFALPGRAAHEAPRLLPPPAAPEVVAAQARALAAAPTPVIEFAPPPRAAAPRTGAVAAVELSELAWLATSASPFTGTRAGLSIRSADLGWGGLRLDVDAQAIRWTARPSTTRFRQSDASQLYVWQAGVTRDLGADRAAVSVGRLMPWRIPGATILDGATAGWRLPWIEAGAFGGLVPQPSTLGPTSDRATGGGYWVWDHAFGRGISLRDEGRLAVVRSPELGTRVEAETRAAARLSRALDLSGSVRLGFGGDAQAPGNVDAARLEVASRPIDHLRLAGWLAYDGLEVPGDAEPMVYAGHTRRAEGSITWDEGSAYRVTLLGGTAKDLSTGLDRGWFGPAIDLP